MPINGSELVVIALLAIVLIGPERLPQYAEQLGRLVRNLRRLSADTSERVRAELGPEFEDLDLRSLDPRQHDPRRIVRDALRDDDGPGVRRTGSTRSAPAGRAPFDDEAT